MSHRMFSARSPSATAQTLGCSTVHCARTLAVSIASRPRKWTVGFLDIQSTNNLYAAIRARSGSENNWNGRANPPQMEGADIANPRTKGTPTDPCPTMKHKSRLFRPARMFRVEAGPGQASF